MLELNKNGSRAQGAKPTGKLSPESPAFPFILDIPNPIDPRQVQRTVFTGMTARDYFAAKAIETAWQESLPTPTGKADWDDIASKAYRIADAMLKAREATVDNKGFPYTDGDL